MRKLLGKLGFVLGPVLGVLYFVFLVLVNVGRRYERVRDPRGGPYGARVVRGARGLLPNIVAITFHKYIFAKPRFPSAQLIAHEFVHVGQYRRLGWLTFLAYYGELLGRFGYEHHPFEVVARSYE